MTKQEKLFTRKKMKTNRTKRIIVYLTQKEINHLHPRHTFYDRDLYCYTVDKIMVKVQKATKKYYKEKRHKMSKQVRRFWNSLNKGTTNENL